MQQKKLFLSFDFKSLNSSCEKHGKTKIWSELGSH